jgi:DegV family protein with EDD domain
VVKVQIVTDSGADLILPDEQKAKLKFHIVPLVVTLDGKSYREGIDIQPDEFYRLLAASENMPVTSQPAVGDLAELYRQLAKNDPEILSIHISSGLSGTVNSAKAASAMVPEANVTVVDAKTLSAAAGWLVEAAAKAINAGWAKEQILSLIEQIKQASNSIYTLKELKYLIHGGRISHMKGLIASLLNIKPLIGVEKLNGTYVQLGQARLFEKAVNGLVDLMSKQHAPGSEMRVQVLHSQFPAGAAMLREKIDQVFSCSWLPMGQMSLVLGAHTGPSMVGVAFAPASTFAGIP